MPKQTGHASARRGIPRTSSPAIDALIAACASFSGTRRHRRPGRCRRRAPPRRSPHTSRRAPPDTAGPPRRRRTRQAPPTGR
ncbi:MAG: hypothetical protein DMF93_17455 [Acidobacteria bacterium]|nr:MAG: hypothetical protein DMF93_17455 [Acidobacteriota bacterium]